MMNRYIGVCCHCLNGFISTEARKTCSNGCSNTIKGFRKGWKHKESSKILMRNNQLMENNSNWKGDEVLYAGLHVWVSRNKPKPPLCEDCQVRAPHDVANISGEYKRDLNDFEWLCRKCHMTKDGRMNNLKQRNKRGVKVQHETKAPS